MGTTKSPKDLVRLAAFWKSQGGRSLGIVGDPKHANKGVSYHLGQDELRADAYSRKGDRDREPHLTNDASAIDLGRLGGSRKALRVFSKWLVRRCLREPAVRHDIREIIYTADGTTVQRYSGVDNKIHRGAGNGDLSHLTHTHISYFRDSRASDKTAAFRPFFKPSWDPAVDATLRAIDPKRVATAMWRTGTNFGVVISRADLERAFRNAGLGFGLKVEPADVEALIVRTARKKKKTP